MQYLSLNFVKHALKERRFREFRAALVTRVPMAQGPDLRLFNALRPLVGASPKARLRSGPLTISESGDRWERNRGAGADR